MKMKTLKNSEKILNALRLQQDKENVIEIIVNYINNISKDEKIKKWATVYKVKDFYSANELRYLWPIIGALLGFTSKLYKPKSEKRLINELDYIKYPVLKNINGTTLFFKQGRYQKFYIVHNFKKWERQCLSQKQFYILEHGRNDHELL